MDIKKDITKDFIYSNEIGGNINYFIKPKTIYDFLGASSSRKKKIPTYQRPYSWKESHLKDFLVDILEASDLNKENKSTWFLGPIYTTQKTLSDEVSLILDGQQRITSLQIILNEIRLSQFYDDSIDFGDFDDVDDNIKNCLFINESGERIPKFESEPATQEFLNEYLIESRNIRSVERYKTFYDEFIHKIGSSTKDSRSIQTLYNNIKITKAFLIDEVINNEELIDEKGKKLSPFLRIKNFANTLLYHFWLIEIPLIEEKVSTEIFESLNNRGKPLGLIDKLMFRSLTQGFENDLYIKQQWGELYKKIDILNKGGKSGVFSSDEDFIKQLFLSLNCDELDDEAEYIHFFTENYLKKFDDLKAFFEQIFWTLDFYIDLKLLNVDKFDYNDDERQKVKSILYVFNRFLKTYNNPNILLLNVLSQINPNQKAHNYIIIQCIWSILMLSYVENIFNGKPPNKVRNSFLSINKREGSNIKYYQNLIFNILNERTNNSKEEFYDLASVVKENNKIKFRYNTKQLGDTSNLLNTKNNSDATCILNLYTLITEHKKFIVYSQDEIGKSHLEHIFPRAWKKAWSFKKYNKEDIAKFVSEDCDEKKIANSILDSDSFELIDYDKKNYIQNDCLIEWIGNKLILNGKKNIIATNDSFGTKAGIYKEYGKILLPSIDSSEMKINLNGEFNAHTIVERSFKIVRKLSNSYLNMNWDSIE